MKKSNIFIFLALFIQSGVSAQPCLPDGIEFNTQAQIDSFQILHPNCTEIEGNVKIDGGDINNLSGLNVLTSIDGDVLIGDSIYPYSSNPLLPSLTGLENMTSIGGDLKIMGNNTITSLMGLDNVIFIGGNLKIMGNNTLTSLTGLDNVTSIGGDLTIDYHDALTSLTALENMTSIEGNLNIWQNYTLTSLMGLDNVTSIGGNLDIYGNYALISLTGLEGLTSIGGSFYFFESGLLTNLTGLDNVTSVGGDLIIGMPDNHSGLTSLAGLEGLLSIGGDLIISNNSSLTSLTGLDNLTFINGNFELGRWSMYFYGGNPLLTSLEGLGNLTSVGGQLSIYRNDSLTSLAGMDNINSIPDLYITNNPSLSNCEAQWLCDYLANPNGSINIHNNATGCNNPPEIASSCGITLPCLPYGNYFFWTQAEIDNFGTNYPNCTSLEGDVQIGDWSLYEITNLSGLNTVTSIGGNLLIHYNHTLPNLTGLDNVLSIGGDLTIKGNDTLTSLTGLDNVTSIGGDLNFYGNNALSSLAGLDNVTSVGGLYIEYNAALTSLTGLENIYAGSISNLNIIYNQLLSTCEVKSVCDYLANPNGSIYIHDNATGCNTPEEVMDSCEAHSGIIDGASIIDRLWIYPNPSSTHITIELPTTPQKNTSLTVSNTNGQQLITQPISKPQTEIDISHLPVGIYIVKVWNDKDVMVQKVIKE